MMFSGTRLQGLAEDESGTADPVRVSGNDRPTERDPGDSPVLESRVPRRAPGAEHTRARSRSAQQPP